MLRAPFLLLLILAILVLASHIPKASANNGQLILIARSSVKALIQPCSALLTESGAALFADYYQMTMGQADFRGTYATKPRGGGHYVCFNHRNKYEKACSQHYAKNKTKTPNQGSRL